MLRDKGCSGGRRSPRGSFYSRSPKMAHPYTSHCTHPHDLREPHSLLTSLWSAEWASLGAYMWHLLPSDPGLAMSGMLNSPSLTPNNKALKAEDARRLPQGWGVTGRKPQGLPLGEGPPHRLANCRRRRWHGLWHSVQLPSWGILEKYNPSPYFRVKEGLEGVWGLSSNFPQT